jgi:peroxiredoxin
LRDRLEVQFTFLADTDSALLDALGIRHQGAGTDGGDIAFPTALLVDSDGIVRWIYQSDTYRQRARPEQIFAAIAAMTGERGR